VHARGREHPVAVVERATHGEIIGIDLRRRRGRRSRRCIEIQRQGVGPRPLVGKVAGDPLDLFDLEFDRGAIPHRKQLLPIDEAMHLVNAHVELPSSLLEGEEFSSHPACLTAPGDCRRRTSRIFFRRTHPFILPPASAARRRPHHRYSISGRFLG
jgi:hypothetical protein